VTYLGEHGLAGLSLRPLATALGTSDRMLVHYFGTKEALVRQALESAMPELGLPSDASPIDTAQQLWARMTQGDQRTRVQLMLEVMALAQTAPEYRELAQAATHQWLNIVVSLLVAHGRPPTRAETEATILVSSLKGLALDLFATGDTARVQRAVEALVTQTLGSDGEFATATAELE